MRYFFTRLSIFLFFFVSSQTGFGQQGTIATLTSDAGNFSSFTKQDRYFSPEVLERNKGYEHNPELGLLFTEAPCKDCYELLGERTENSKTFLKAGTNGKDVMKQTASGPMHFKGTDGQWHTIQSKLKPGTVTGAFAAPEQLAPVLINTNEKFSSLGTENSLIKFNNKLELVFQHADGSQESLGVADYSHYSAGDDGVYISNAWPGIDIQMLVVRGAIKTNFVINHAMPAYSGGSVLVRDHLELSGGLSLFVPGENKLAYTGDLEIRGDKNERIYSISQAVAFEKAAGRSTLRLLPYAIKGTQLDIIVPGSFLNRPASAYPVIIDPLVSYATSSTVTGSKYSPTWTSGCAYINAASVPPKVTVTDVQFTFQYVASGGALTNNGAYEFTLGTCRSPMPASLFWNCSSGLPGTCDAVGATIYSGQIGPCIPAPTCSTYDLNITMKFYQNYASAPGCSPAYISAGTPLTITVFGHTVESNSVVAVPSSVCAGQSTVLTASSVYGVGPYTYSWAPGGATGASFTVTPPVTTTYTVTSTDACGDITSATQTINVNPVTPIAGNTTICSGGSSALSSSPAGGIWTSSSTAVATIGSSTGIATGSGLGTSTITYTTAAGCSTTTPVNVIAPVAPIMGYMVVCSGSTTSLSSASSGGIWTSSNTSVGTVGSTSGFATGISGGTTTISYTTSSGAGCSATGTLTVNPLAPITGAINVCVGGTANMSNAIPGGTWSSSNPAIGSITSVGGVVTGVSAGTVIITYTTPNGCISTTAMAVNLLSPITGTTNVCQGNSTTLSDAASGGTWTSANPAVASIASSSGVVSGLSGGVASITYTTPAGCYATTNYTVNAIGPIIGVTSVCTGGSSPLTDAAGAGNWNSSNPSVASVGATTGVLTGLSVGSANITYTSPAGCTATALANVGSPTPITGTMVVCERNTTTLSDGTSGGTWTSATPAVASIDPSTGIVTGNSGGNTSISYTLPSGCIVTATLTVNPAPANTGNAPICVGGAVSLTNSVAGGSWTSGTPAIASVSASGAVTGAAAGNAPITYTTPAGCLSITTVTVGVPAAITGTTTVCQGNTTTLSNSVAGGTWSSSNSAIAMISPSAGIVGGVSGGVATISYSTPGGCNATTSITINPIAPITGSSTICAGTTSALSDATPGGSWASSNISIATIDASGVLSGVSSGTSSITYTTPAGCTATVAASVNNTPSAITGSTLVCSTTSLSDAVTGGTWTSSNTSIAAVNPSTGFVTGGSIGNVTITYSLPGGCNTTIQLTVDPVVAIGGTPSVCQGLTTVLSYPHPGGTWSSSATSIATIDPTGVVTGVSGGTSSVIYTNVSGCIANTSVTVFPSQPIAGPGNVCQGGSITLSNSVSGGTWSSSTPSIATVVASTGVVSGTASGVTTITYTTGFGCVQSTIVTVNPIAPTTGTAAICAGNTTTLNNPTPGGTWISSVPAVATIDPSSGLLTGVIGGVTTIAYTTTAGCVAYFSETINALPSAIGGVTKVCVGSTIALTNTLTGGRWTISNPAVATINPVTGIVSGIAPDTVTVTYTSAAGCSVSTIVTVNALPAGITGITSICQGATATLNDITPGGTWTSFVPAVASVGFTTGVVVGIAVGSTNITYTTPQGCSAVTAFAVNPLPGAITGTLVVCEGATTTLHNSLPGGSWSSANTATATVSVAGVVRGVAAGVATISYVTPAGCFATTSVTVNPTPVISATSFTGPTTCVNSDGTITLNGLISGNTYSVNYVFNTIPVGLSATANSSGAVVLSGLAVGIYSNFTVTNGFGCTSAPVSGPIGLLNPPTPPAPVAASNSPICEGSLLHLSATDGMIGVTYSWNGPGGFTATGQNVSLNPSTLGEAGTYTVTATKLACVSPSATTTVIIHTIPAISTFTYTNPTTCQGTDGVVILKGLNAGVTYNISYLFNGTPVTTTVVANSLGNVVITGLAAGSYSNFNVSSFTCTSNSVGPVTMHDPAPPAAPKISSNSPVCAGKTLNLECADNYPGIEYNWQGPNGFTSDVRNPQLPNITLDDSGSYTLTIKYLNCPATTSENVTVNPPLTLTNVTTDQVIPLGGSITLHAEGAKFYMWTPNDGSIDNPNIDTPSASPVQRTVYTVIGMNNWGCVDSASFTIDVDQHVSEGIPNAFTPNGDGRNDVFKIENAKYDKLDDFRVFNRWGQIIYHNNSDINQGWDGTFNGVPQDMGVYDYIIIVVEPNGKQKVFKGAVTLVR